MSTGTPAVGADKCKHVLTAGKAGVIIGMLSVLHGPPTKWGMKVGFNFADEEEVDYGPRWAAEMGLLCGCLVCYRVCLGAVQAGRQRKVRVEDFGKYPVHYRPSLIKTLTISHVNNAIVSLLPGWYEALEK